MNDQLNLKKNTPGLPENRQSPLGNIVVENPDAADGFIMREAKYQIGQVVRHRLFEFRGVIFDVDPAFSNTEEWYQSIPEDVRPSKDQPYYHLFAENANTHYVAYVSEQNLLVEKKNTRINHPDIHIVFDVTETGYTLKAEHTN